MVVLLGCDCGVKPRWIRRRRGHKTTARRFAEFMDARIIIGIVFLFSIAKRVDACAPGVRVLGRVLALQRSRECRHTFLFRLHRPVPCRRDHEPDRHLPQFGRQRVPPRQRGIRQRGLLPRGRTRGFKHPLQCSANHHSCHQKLVLSECGCGWVHIDSCVADYAAKVIGEVYQLSRRKLTLAQPSLVSPPSRFFTVSWLSSFPRSDFGRTPAFKAFTGALPHSRH